MPDLMGDPAMATYFTAVLDTFPLGAWTGIDGLSCTIATEKIDEGGNPLFSRVLRGRTTYGDVKLTRPVNADSALIAQMISKSALLRRLPGAASGAAVITCLSSDGTPITMWTLADAVLVSWTGPTLGADKTTVATETITIAHHGFLPGV